jgi:hypothetical protein
VTNNDISGQNTHLFGRPAMEDGRPAMENRTERKH